MRKKQENPKAKELILEAAQSLMLAKGFSATSLDEICKKAGLTKGCFFHYFQGKDDLAKAVLERFASRAHEGMSSCGCGCEQKDPLKRVYAYLDFAIKMGRDPKVDCGCIIGSFAQEMSDTHPEIRSICAEGFRQWAKVLEDDLKAAQVKYKPKVKFNPKELAQFFIAVFEGSQIMAKAMNNRGVIEKNMSVLRQHVFAIFNA